MSKISISKSIKENILSAKAIAVIGHINPDGDSIGSLLALGLGLKRLGKQIFMVSPDGVPKRYMSLPGARKITKNINRTVDLAISVDCSNKEILGRAYNIFLKAKETLEIDHHEFRRPFGNLFLVDTKAAAVGEIIYVLLEDLGLEVDRAIAENLLTSIVVETNSFRLPQVKPLTFQICYELIKKGLNFYRLVDMVFWSRTRQSVLLSGICMSRCRFLKNGRLVWSIIRKKDFKKFKGKDEDVDHVSDEMRSIKRVEISILFRESHKGFLRVSLRSKGRINVARIAEYFNGGGHFDVAGCYIPDNQESIKKVLTMASDLL